VVLAPASPSWKGRIVVGSLLLSPPLADWLARRPDLDPLRYTLGALADDAAYGAGVLAGCLIHRTAAPLRPVIVRPAGSTPS
jgi:hypothetical protein